MNTPPDMARLMAVLEATWPPAETAGAAGFRLRRGAGGGKRVSAASPVEPDPGAPAVDAAVAGMAKWGQSALFQLTEADAGLDTALADSGYTKVDPTLLYVGAAADLTGDDKLPVAHSRRLVPALMAEIWAEGGIGPDRLAVMDRVKGPSMRLLGRAGDRPAGAAFVAVDGDTAMIHAIEVRPRLRRQGVGLQLMQAGARFALANGAPWFALAVTEANTGAQALYRRMGMAHAGGYHYRLKEGA